MDPIDGTLNYSTGLAGAACSIALLHDGQPIVGAISDFSSGMTYRALAGSGTILCDDGTGEVRMPALTVTRWFSEDLHRMGLGGARSGDGGHDRGRLATAGRGSCASSAAPPTRFSTCRCGAAASWGSALRIWDVAAGVVLAREAGLDVRLWEEGTSIHVIAGSAEDLRELAPIVETFGTSRAAAIA